MSIGSSVLESASILIQQSLAETLWRLEEVRLGFRKGSDADVEEALQWVLSRQGLEGSYGGLFLPTKSDLAGVKLLTGELITSASLRHILAEEALRTTIVWNRRSSQAVRRAIENYNLHILGKGNSEVVDGKRIYTPSRETGFFCCCTCTPAFLRTLSVVRPEKWDEILEKGIGHIRKRRKSDGRWQSFPFYYTLLALSEMDIPSAKDELRHASKTAGKLVKRYRTKDDRMSRFRRLGLEAAIGVA